MKKALTLTLALVYLSTSSGMVANVQYCFNKIFSVQINGFGDNSCCCTGAAKKAGCCSDEIKLVKLQESNRAAFTDYIIENSTERVSAPLSLIDSSPVTSTGRELIQIADSSPPVISAPPIFIRNCIFRI